MEAIISAGLEELGLSAYIPPPSPARLAQYGQLLDRKSVV